TLPLITLPQPPVHFRIARLPHLVANMNPLELNVPPSKPHFRRLPISAFGLRPSDFINPSPLFLVLRLPRVEHHPIARLQRPSQPHPDPLALHPRHFPQEHPALLAKPAMHERLVVRAAKPPGIKPARERHLHLVAVLTR